MAGERPTILVVGDDRDERAAITAVLRDAGFAVAASAHDRGARAALTRTRFAAAVIALPEAGGVALRRHARRQQPGFKALIVIEPGATRFADADDDTLLARPFDARHLLGCVFELVLREGGERTPHHSRAAELGIAAAELACLDSRRSAASAAGAQGLARDLARRIRQTTAMHRRLASGGSAVIPAAAD
jgi:DNA-binding response OmpR family regulator